MIYLLHQFELAKIATTVGLSSLSLTQNSPEFHKNLGGPRKPNSLFGRQVCPPLEINNSWRLLKKNLPLNYIAQRSQILKALAIEKCK